LANGINVQMDDLCKNHQVHKYIPLVVLDDFYKLNCFLIFFRLFVSIMWLFNQVFFKENFRYLVWTCRDPISLILGT